MNIYIDCGAYDGDTLDSFKLFGFKADYTIAFEPNPKFFATLATKKIDELHNAVVWIKDTVLTYAQDISPTPYGSTVMKSKAQYKTGNKLDVHAIDLAVFLEKYKDDTILLKMDIEGAEFPVLEHLIKTGADKYINKLYVEMHPNKVPEYTSTYSATLLSRLKCGEVNEWH